MYYVSVNWTDSWETSTTLDQINAAALRLPRDVNDNSTFISNILNKNATDSVLNNVLDSNVSTTTTTTTSTSAATTTTAGNSSFVTDLFESVTSAAAEAIAGVMNPGPEVTEGVTGGDVGPPAREAGTRESEPGYLNRKFFNAVFGGYRHIPLVIEKDEHILRKENISISVHLAKIIVHFYLHYDGQLSHV